jgi:anti-anti-sigma factor
MTDTITISSDRIGADTEVLTLDGKCDLLAAVAAERRIVWALAAGANHIIFDLRGVTSFSAPMLHMLFRGLMQVGAENGRLVLVRPNASVWGLFEQNGMDRGFASTPDLKGALVEAAA